MKVVSQKRASESLESGTSVREGRRLYSARVIFVICASLLMFGATYAHLVSFFGDYNSEMGNSNLEYGIVLATYPLVQRNYTEVPFRNSQVIIAGKTGLSIIGSVLNPLFAHFAKRGFKTGPNIGIRLPAHFANIGIQKDHIFTGPLATKLSTSNLISDKSLLVVSLVVDATFCMMPAFLNMLQLNPRLFLVLLIAVRAVQSVGGTTGSVLVYIINGVEIPHITHAMIPILETVYGAAVVIGPAIGAVLCDFFNFNAPFLVLGGAEAVLALVTLVVLPPSPALSDGHGSAKFRKAAKPNVVLNILTTVNAFLLIAYNEATLTLQLEPFGLSKSIKGLIFFFPAGVYAMSSLFFGFQIKRFSDPRIIIIGGSILSSASMIGLGPLMSVWPRLPLVLLCQVGFGLGLGPAFVCSYLHSVHVIDNGQESKEALAIVTGLMEPSVAVGNLLGSVFAGWMLQVFNYTIGVSINIAQLGLIVALQSSLLIAERCSQQRRAKQQQEIHTKGQCSDNADYRMNTTTSTQSSYGAVH